MEFLNNLEFLLHENNMSRAELARNIGIAPSTVNAWLRDSKGAGSMKRNACYVQSSGIHGILRTLSFSQGQIAPIWGKVPKA